VHALQGDVHDAASLVRLFAGHDVVVHSLHFAGTEMPGR
jgi:putative NADH-flavin reductase